MHEDSKRHARKREASCAARVAHATEPPAAAGRASVQRPRCQAQYTVLMPRSRLASRRAAQFATNRELFFDKFRDAYRKTADIGHNPLQLRRATPLPVRYVGALDGQGRKGDLPAITYTTDAQGVTIATDVSALHDGHIPCYLTTTCTRFTCDMFPVSLYYDTGVPMAMERIMIATDRGDNRPHWIVQDSDDNITWGHEVHQVGDSLTDNVSSVACFLPSHVAVRLSVARTPLPLPLTACRLTRRPTPQSTCGNGVTSFAHRPCIFEGSAAETAFLSSRFTPMHYNSTKRYFKLTVLSVGICLRRAPVEELFAGPSNALPAPHIVFHAPRDRSLPPRAQASTCSGTGSSSLDASATCPSPLQPLRPAS
jgi:hypothetical protein